MKNVLAILIAVSLILSGCDMTRVLRIKARKNTSVKVYGKETLLRNDKYTTKKTIIRVPDTSGRSRVEIIHGFANWNNETVSQLTAEIDSIILTNKRQVRVLKNQDELHSYLMKCRRGLLKGVIKIKAR